MNVFNAALLMSALTAPLPTYTIDLNADLMQTQPSQIVLKKIEVQEGKTDTLTLGDTTLKITPVKVDDGSVRLETQVLRQTANGLELVAKRALTTHLDETAEATERKSDGTPAFTLKLTPHVQTADQPVD